MLAPNLSGPEGHWVVVSPSRRVTALRSNAQVLLARGKLHQAEPLLQEDLMSSRRLHGEEHPDTLVSKSNMAQLLAQLGRWLHVALAYRGVLLSIDHSLESFALMVLLLPTSAPHAAPASHCRAAGGQRRRR